MGKKQWIGFLLVGAVCSITVVWAAEGGDQSALAKAMPGATVTLQRGLTVSASQGKPISGQFEMDEGKFQLSVYTAKAGKFFEVIVDHGTGKVAKAEAITSGEDFAEAQAQSKAMAHVKGTLKAVVDRAEHEHPGFRAVSVAPKLTEGHPVAVVTLVKGDQFKSTSEPLE